MDSVPIFAFILALVACVLSLLFSRRSARLRQLVLFSWVVLIVLGCFLPTLQTALWHLRHGISIRYKDKNIPIPPRWIASTSTEGILQGVQLTKLPISILFGDRPQGLVFLSPLEHRSGESLQEISRSWVSRYWTLHDGRDEVVSGPFMAKSGPGDAEVICMESFNRRVRTSISVSCLLFRGTWTADFFGDKRDITGFLGIVRKANWAKE
jgi:hypothetical protein